MGVQRAEERLLLHKVEGFSFEIVQAVEIFPIQLNGGLFARRREADDGFKQVAFALLDHLTERMQIGGKFRSYRENALSILALALTEELLPPSAERAERRLIAAEHLNFLPLAVEQIADCRILPCRVFKGADVQLLPGTSRTQHHIGRIDARHSHRKQSDRRQHAVASADIGRNDKALISFFRCHLAQGTAGGIGRNINALFCLFRAVFAFEHPAQRTGCDSRLRCCAGFGNDIDGKILALQKRTKLLPCAGGKVIARKEHLRIVSAKIVLLTLDQLDCGTRPEIGAADTDNDKHFGIVADTFCRTTNAAHLLRFFKGRKIQPTQEIIAQPFAIRQQLVCIENLLLR